MDPRAATRRWAERWLSCLVVAGCLLLVLLSQPWVTHGGDASIRSDGLGYHAWTRALLDRDLSFCGYGDLAGAISYRDEARGVCQNKYPPGLALLRLPVMAPLVASGSDAPFVVSSAEHRANDVLAALALLGTAVLLVRTGRRLGFSNLATQVSALGVVFGTGLFHYGTYDASFTHVWSALGFALLVHAWSGVRGRSPGLGVLAQYAGVCLALVLVRQTNLLVLAVVGLAVVVDERGWRQDGFWRVVPPAAAAAAGTAVALSVQLAYNRWATGDWRLSSYGEEPFLLDRPMQRSVLLSYERGLATWYPLVAVALAAGLAVRRSRGFALVAAGGVVVLTVLYGYWSSWMLGGGFGHRGFVELAPLLFLPLAAALDRPEGQRRRWLLGAVALCTAVTLELMLGYWAGSIWFQGTSPSTYWAHVLGEQSWLGPLARAVGG